MKTENVRDVEARIILLKALKKEAGWTHEVADELATLKCWLYNRQRGQLRMELTKEAFYELG